MMTRALLAMLVSQVVSVSLAAQTPSHSPHVVVRFPEDRAEDVNPDTHLVLTFPGEPSLGHSGEIRIYDAADDRLVDVLDMSVPPGPITPNRERAPYTPTPYVYTPGRRFTNANTRPGTPSGGALPTPDTYQLTIIGGFTDAFHFYPVIIRGNVATIYLHHNLLECGKTYYVQIDPGVLTVSGGSFSGITGKNGWTFTTKKAPPPADSTRLVVSGDGTGDFNTVQGAIDFIPDRSPNRVTIFIRNGIYEEIVYFRNKSNITFLGEDRDRVVVCYANSEVFNPHPANIATNEWPGTFPSRRAAFMGDQAIDVRLVNLTIKSIHDKPAQAEGLLLTGERNIVSNVTVIGSGDALQINGSVYLEDIQLTGFGDNVLGRGPAFFNHCELVTTYGPHLWIRNTAANHGNVLVNCTLRAIGNVETTIARRDDKHTHAEAVLIDCALAGIRPVGWGSRENDVPSVHYWEYNSVNVSDGRPVDVSQRHPISRQLTLEKHAQVIADYRNPTYVLGGWTPSMAPLILLQPESITTTAGRSAVFRVKVAAVPAATYQWFNNGRMIPGATSPVLVVDHVWAGDAGTYTVAAKNPSGGVTSQAATLTVQQ